MDDLLSEFLTETNERLAALDVELVKLEKNPNDAELLSNIFRLMHTIKGACRALGLLRLESVAHAGENVLGKIREGDLVATSDTVSLILESLDCIRSILAVLEASEVEPEGDDSDLTGRLNVLADGGTADAASVEAEPAEIESNSVEETQTAEEVISQDTESQVELADELKTGMPETENQVEAESPQALTEQAPPARQAPSAQQAAATGDTPKQSVGQNMRRKALGAVKIATRAKAERSDLGAEMFQHPAHIDTLVSIIAVVNLKGGVGKSTIAVNLACELAGRQSVVVVDADSQATATDWARRGDLPARVETLPLDAESRVGPWVERVLTLQADHVVIDCPPHIGPATLAATGIADMVLVPVTPSGVDLVATDSALALVHDAQVARKDGGPLCLLVPSKVDRRTAVGRELAAALERFDEPVGPEIGQRAALVDAFAVGAWIGQYAPRNEARRQFRDLATAVKRRWLMELRRLRSGGGDHGQKNIGASVEFKVARASEAPALR